MIKVENLVKKYGDFTAVDNISFELSEGEIMGFLGPNGAGKTTTLRMITGFTPATSGKAFICGNEIFENPMEVKKNIGYLPEFPPLYPDLKVKDYLSFVADIKQVSSKNKKENTDFVVNKCGLENVFNKEIKKLSKGYKQRVGIAQALIHRPKILLLDEPTSGLDPIQIIEVRNLIKELRKEHTIILSSHILPEVSAICSKIVIINKGRIVAQDAPENLSTRMNRTWNVEFETSDTEKVMNIMKENGEILNINSNNSKICIEIENRNIIPDIIKDLVKNNIAIMSVVPKTASLEDVFLHLTHNEEV